MKYSTLVVWTASLVLPAMQAFAQQAPTAEEQNDIPVVWHAQSLPQDYDRREAMIPMRDGIRLRTLIFIPHSQSRLPILLERTPYDASSFVDGKTHLRAAVWPAAREWVDDGYILVFQDVRGKYSSEGNYVMTRPPRGPLNTTATDESTDAWDTIDWLIKNTPQSNQRVGMIGSSYDGWTVAMALLNPHPALKVAAPESPMIDGWIGDDWFHNGAFRQVNMNYFLEQTSAKSGGAPARRFAAEDYDDFLSAGSAGDWATRAGMTALPFWQRLTSHPAYDSFWQQQAMNTLLSRSPSSVPTIWLQGMWDQEDIYGAFHTWEQLCAAGAATNNHLVIGPWYHSQINTSGDRLGPLKWPNDTTVEFRKHIMVPFFDSYLKDGQVAHPLPAAMLYDPAEKHWDEFTDWHSASGQKLLPLYLQANRQLSFADSERGEDPYTSDPTKPVPFMEEPVHFDSAARWDTWLVADQRFASTRPDVLVYETEELTAPLRIVGEPIADLFAKTTGTDGDFVVKLIDVYPQSDLDDMSMAGYQLPVSLDIFRGRYRVSMENPQPIPANTVEEYKFRLPTVDYTFGPRHRVMVQIQSSLFPLYDRNPQRYVENIFFAKPSDYVPAMITIERGGSSRSAVLLPVVGAIESALTTRGVQH